jgi:hypothetical protein
MDIRQVVPAAIYAFVAGSVFGAHGALADVTVTELTTVDASIAKIRLTATERTTADRQRRDADGKLDGTFSFLAGPMRSATIVRLDRGLEWHLEADQKRYRENLFPTEAERQAARQRQQTQLEKLKQCAANTAQTVPTPAPNCEKTDPKFDVTQTSETAVIAGHPVRKAHLSMTYACKDVNTGDTCDFAATSDLWLTDAPLPGLQERSTFGEAYRRKLGLDEASSAMVAPMRLALAPYQDQLQRMSERAAELKGTPLRTSFALSVSGARCAVARSGSGAGSGGGLASAATAEARDAGAQAATSEGNYAAHDAVTNALGDNAAGRVLGTAAGAFNSKLLGGLFSRKSSANSAQAATATPEAATPRTMISLTTEITSMSNDPIPADQFELPAGWQKVAPQLGKNHGEDSQCPRTGD